MSKLNNKTTHYEICVRGHLAAHWADWFDGLSLHTSFAADGEPITMLVGDITDQSALSGLLVQLSDLNLSLISVNPTQKNK